MLRKCTKMKTCFDSYSFLEPSCVLVPKWIRAKIWVRTGPRPLQLHIRSILKWRIKRTIAHSGLQTLSSSQLHKWMLPPALRSPPPVNLSQQWANAMQHDPANRQVKFLISPVSTSCFLSWTHDVLLGQLNSSLTDVLTRFRQQPKILNSSFTKQV